MGKLNLYKIKEITKLKEYLNENFEHSKPKKVTIESRFDNQNESDKNYIDYSMTLYYDYNNDTHELDWAWVCDLCDVNMNTQVSIRPKGILLIENKLDCYAASFGSAYYYPNYYSNKEWAFNYAQGVDFKKIKLTASTIPNSKRNKQVNAYVNYNRYDPNSGESLNQLDVDIELNSDDNEIMGNNFKVGNSLKLTIKDNNLESIAQVIDYVEYTISNAGNSKKFPRLTEITDKNIILEYDKKIREEICNDVFKLNPEYPVNFSQFFAYGSNIQYLDDFSKFKFVYGKKDKIFEELIIDNLYYLIKEWEIKIEDNFLEEIKIEFYNNDVQYVEKVKLKNIIYYDYIEGECIFDNGKWQKYNKDYLACLADSLSNIECYNFNEFSFYDENYLNFINKKYENEEGFIDNLFDLSDNIINKYSTEEYFNMYLAEEKDYVLWDRKFKELGAHKVEIMDLYKDNTAFAVKIGSGSANLAYVVDQSLEGIRFIRNKKEEFEEKIDTVCIWLVLTRKSKLKEDENGNVNIYELKGHIILKNKLDSWKKEVLLMGYKPLIRINYKLKGNYKDNYLELNSLND